MRGKVFLGGTCNGSTWRDELIPELSIDYFNPVVEGWTNECYEEELHQRAMCDVLLYTITPKMEGVYSIAEVVDGSNKRPERTILFIKPTDDTYAFSQAQLKSLKALSKMVENNGARVFRDKEELIRYLNYKEV